MNAYLHWRCGLLIALLLAACQQRALPTSASEFLARSEALYGQHCAECHGVNLEGQPNWKAPNAQGVYPASPHNNNGHTWHHPDELLLQIIAYGGSMPASAMPGFDKKLSDEEMEAILDYIKSHWGLDELEFQMEVTRNVQQQ